MHNHVLNLITMYMTVAAMVAMYMGAKLPVRIEIITRDLILILPITFNYRSHTCC